ncbi:unnamed protein product [Cylicocyclus nassatus]|uniref:RecQ-mediated genome instability protein 1 n=1 Tax=Cylicocyclus nassatus TaxID=53992 RepID=A0AA36GKY5_CYLNA|nr:unnamed protein product [Cylicocyclus nassatus]
MYFNHSPLDSTARTSKTLDFTPFYLVSVINIARSAYEQYCERSTDVDDLSWFHGEDERNEYAEQLTANFSEKRFLKFKLTDGQNVLHAIQYGEVEFLDEDSLPGLKILLISRVLLRRGILLLNSSNCQVLGGDVERKLSAGISPLVERLGAGNIAKTRYEVTMNPNNAKQEAKAETRKANHSSNKGANLSTISPFLVRLPRPQQASLNNQAEAREARMYIKQEVERTAIVPPLQTIASQNDVKVAVRKDVRSGGNLLASEHSPIQQWKSADFDVPTPVEMNDLPIPLDNTTLIMHNKLHTEKKRECNLPRSLPIAEYFPVSRGGSRNTVKNRAQPSPTQSNLVRNPNDTRADVIDVRDSAVLLRKLASTKDTAPCTWSDHQRSLFSKNKPNPLIQTSSHLNAHVASRASLLLPFENPEKTTPSYKTPPSSTLPRTPQRDSDFGNRNGTQFVIDVHNSIAANDIHPGDYAIGEDSDYISFIEKSFTEEFKQKQRQSAVQLHTITNAPPTAIVPYKRPRRTETLFDVSGGVTWQSRSSDQLKPSAIMDKFINLKVTLLAEVLAKRRFWMLPKIVNVMVSHQDNAAHSHGYL